MRSSVLSIEQADVEAAARWDTTQRAAERAAAEDVPFGRWIAGAALARGLARENSDLQARWHAHGDEWPGLLELARPAADAERHVLVLAEPSSMEPRPVWPVRVPIGDLEAWLYDAVIWAYVPKRAPLEAGDSAAMERGVHVAGWAWADEARSWERVHLDPHPGHPFPDDVLQAQVRVLHPLDTLTDAVFGSES